MPRRLDPGRAVADVDELLRCRPAIRAARPAASASSAARRASRRFRASAATYSACAKSSVNVRPLRPGLALLAVAHHFVARPGRALRRARPCLSDRVRAGSPVERDTSSCGSSSENGFGGSAAPFACGGLSGAENRRHAALPRPPWPARPAGNSHGSRPRFGSLGSSRDRSNRARQARVRASRAAAVLALPERKARAPGIGTSRPNKRAPRTAFLLESGHLGRGLGALTQVGGRLDRCAGARLQHRELGPHLPQHGAEARRLARDPARAPRFAASAASASTTRPCSSSTSAPRSRPLIQYCQAPRSEGLKRTKSSPARSARAAYSCGHADNRDDGPPAG